MRSAVLRDSPIRRQEFDFGPRGCSSRAPHSPICGQRGVSRPREGEPLISTRQSAPKVTHPDHGGAHRRPALPTPLFTPVTILAFLQSSFAAAFICPRLYVPVDSPRHHPSRSPGRPTVIRLWPTAGPPSSHHARAAMPLTTPTLTPRPFPSLGRNCDWSPAASIPHCQRGFRPQLLGHASLAAAPCQATNHDRDESYLFALTAPTLFRVRRLALHP